MSEKLYYARVESLDPIQGADRIKKATILGFDIIVGADIKVGDFGFLYLPDSVITDNAVAQFGEEILEYVGKNRRVRAIQLKETYSLGMFVHRPDMVNAQSLGNPVPRVLDLYTDYVPPMKDIRQQQKAAKKAKFPGFPEHFNTQQYLANKKRLLTATATPGSVTSITLKMHGTSHRVGRIKAKTEYPWYSRPYHWALQKLGLEDEFSYRIIAGTRRVILDPDDDTGYHSLAFRDRVTTLVRPLIKTNQVWYFEVVGWEDASRKIMGGDYLYGIPQGEFQVYVYRITENGKDLSHADMIRTVDTMCIMHNSSTCQAIRNVFPVPTLVVYNGTLPEDAPKDWLEHVEKEEFADANGGHIQEGICIRVDIPEENEPLILKYKSKAFLVEECGHNPDWPEREDNAE